MRARTCVTFVAFAAAIAGATTAGERFQTAVWVDHFDFQRPFDTEKPEGWSKILDHMEEVGATTVLWRNRGGATMRYQSKVDSHHHSSILDKRRVHDVRDIGGWVRYGEARPDIIGSVVKMCRQRGLRPGVHWPFEETHFGGWTIGGWNLDHPQYWSRNALGQSWWGRSSLAYEPVVEHKLALVDELIDRGIEVLFIDFWRSGGWSPLDEYVPPVVKAYRKLTRENPPPDGRDLRWCRHVSTYVTAFMRRLRQRLDASGREIELAVGIPKTAPNPDTCIIERAADWRTWLAEGLIDTLVINYVEWDKEDPMGCTRMLYRQVMKEVAGRCRVWCPVQQYNYSRHGLPQYQKATGRANEDLAAELTRMAWEEGAQGISLECVDYNNYRPKTRDALRTLSTGLCKAVRAGVQ